MDWLIKTKSDGSVKSDLIDDKNLGEFFQAIMAGAVAIPDFQLKSPYLPENGP